MFRIILLIAYFTTLIFANEKVVLQLKWFHQFQFAGYYAAKEKGFYEELGLDVEIRQRDIKYNNIKQVIDGEAQYGIADSVLFLYKAKKEPIVIVAPIFQHSPSVLLTLKSSGLDSVYDLNSKDMIFYENDTDGFSILAMLKKLNIKPNIIRKRTKNDYIKLIDKEVDISPAYLSNEPFYFKQRNIGINTIDPTNYGFDLYGDILFASEDEVVNHPQRVKKFKEATLRGWEYALDNKDEIIALIKEKYNTKKSLEHLNYEAEAIKRVISKETTPLGSIDRGRIQYIYDLYKEYGLVQSDLDVKGFIFNDYETSANNLNLTKEEKEYLLKNPTLTIPNMSTFPPFSFYDNGKPLGYTIDYMKLMADYMNVKLNIVSGKTWAEYLNMLKNKKLDVIPHISITEDRKKFVTYTNFVHLEFNNSLVVKKNTNISSVNDIKDKIIAVQNKTFQHTFLKQNYPNIKLLLVSSTKDGVRAVSENRVDAFIGNLPTIEYYIQKDWLSDLTTVKIEDWALPLKTKLYMGVEKNNLLLKSILEKVEGVISRKEELKLKDRWLNINLLENVLTLTKPELSYLNSKQEITMCIDPDWMPFEKIEDNKHIGITSDYVKIFEEQLGIPIKLIKTNSWLETIEFAKSRKCDFITSISETKDRKKYFNFTNSLMDTPIVIATKTDKPFVNTILDIKDEKIGIVKGFAYISILKNKYPNLNIVEVENAKKGLKKVANGQLYGLIGVLQVLGYNIQKDYFGSLKIDGKLNASWSFPMATRNDEPLLNSIFNKLISNVSEETHNLIMNKWTSIKFEDKIDYTKIIWVSLVFFIILIIIIYKNRSINEINGKMQEYITVVDENVLTSSTDRFGNIISASQAFCNISGYSKSELLGQNHRIIRHPDMKDELFETMWETISSGRTWKGEIKNRKKNGNYYWVNASISPNFDDKGLITGYTSIRQDITARKKVEEISITDELTTLYNKRYFNEMFEKEVNRAKREERLISFIIFDIDHFKQYNDNYGHQKGDEVLNCVGKAIKECCTRASDIPFRIGGEEFGIISSPHFKENAIEFAQKLKEKIESLKIEHKFSSTSEYVTVSMGLYVNRAEKIHDTKEIYKLADEALYEAKKKGRNRIELV